MKDLAPAIQRDFELNGLKLSKRIKAKIAANLLALFPPDPNMVHSSRLQKKLSKWASRADIRTHGRNGEAQHALPGIQPAKLVLSETYATSRSSWDRFLDKLSETTASRTRCRKILTVVSEGAKVKTRGYSRCFDTDIRLSGHSDLAQSVKDLKNEDWVLFAQAQDCILLGQLDYLTNETLAETQIVIPDLGMIYDDQVHPVLAPGANYLFALNCPLQHSRFFARAGAVREAKSRGAVTAQDIALNLLETAHRSRKRHQAVAAGRPMIETHGERGELANLRAKMAVAADAVLPSPSGPVASGAVDLSQFNGVSVVICTKDKGFYIRQLVARLLAYPEQIVRDVIIVSNNTTNIHALETLRCAAKQERVKLFRFDGPFHFSAQSNLGARHARGEMVLFLNDDIVPIGERWLEELMAPFVDPNTVATGPLLLYPDERIQHAGMVLGHGDVAGHFLRGHKLPDQEFNVFASAPRFVSCVTGAALLVRKADFDAVNGFDRSLRLWIQDVDLCMRLSASGGKIVFNPKSTLFHMESLSVRDTLDNSETARARGRELDYFRRRWPPLARRDPYHPALLDKRDLTCRRLIQS